jgi:hypothetical protein
MSRTDKCTLAVVLAVIFVVFPCRLGWDLTHPRQWETPGQDPHVYGWGFAAVWVIFIYVTVRIVNCERKTRARKVRLAALYARVEHFIRGKRWREAEGVLRECERLANEKYI